MKHHTLNTIEDLKPAPYNPREISSAAVKGISASIAQFGDISGIVWNSRTGHLVAGHQRLAALIDHGAVFISSPPRIAFEEKDFPIRIVDWDDLTERAANISANNTYITGDFLDDKLQSILNEIKDVFSEFNDLQLDMLLSTDNPYSGKVEIPVYTPSGEKPKLTELVNTEKCDAFITKIDLSNDISDDLKAFLRLAAQRMLVFNYEKIANYYAHANVNEQDFFEHLALVIIDFNKAIEYVFVKMTKKIRKLYTDEYCEL